MVRKFFTYENKVLLILFFTFGFVFFDRQALTFLIPFITQELELSNTQIGLLASTLALAWAISGPLVGFFSDRMGMKKNILAIFVILFSAVSLLHGLASSFVVLLLLRFLMGIAEGPVLPIAQSIMAAESSPSRRGFNMGFLQSTSASLLGSVLAPLIIVAIATAYGWRTSFYLTILPGIVLALLIWRKISEPKKVEISNAQEKSDVKLKDVIKHRNIWLSTIICCFSLTWFIVFITFAPVYLVMVKNLTAGEMALIISAVGFGGVLWGFAVPALSDRFGRKPTMVVFSMISALSPLAILFIDSSLALLALAVFLFHTGQGCQPLFMSTIPAESIPMRYLAMSVGLIMGVGELFGGVLAPLLAGMAADHISAAAPLWICSGGAVIATVLSMFIKETAPVKLTQKESSSIGEQFV